jgi:hypothetical protein
MTVHPRLSGGEMLKERHSGNTTWRIHRPVFDGLTGERSRGTLRIDALGNTASPDSQPIAVDYDNDGQADFDIVLPATPDGEPSIKAHNARVGGIERVAHVKNGYLISIIICK